VSAARAAANGLRLGHGLLHPLSGYRVNIPRMFAALLLLSLAGVAIFFALSALSQTVLRRWHESAVRREI
jgi:NitT/TauT family transport system permease protein